MISNKDVVYDLVDEMTTSNGASTRLQAVIGSQVTVASQSTNFMNTTSSTEPCYDMQTTCGNSSSDSHSPLNTGGASSRDARIFAEKQRRSQYNALITEIMSLLSDALQSQRKVDKTSVLRLAANKLRNDHIFGNTMKCRHIETWSPGFFKFFDLLGGIMIGITCRGRIFIVSPNVQEKLGYSHIDLLGQDLYKYVHEEDHEHLREHIYPPELQNNCDKKLFEQHHIFHIRILRAGARSDPPRFERCRIDGILRRSDKATANAVQDEQIIKRQRVRNHRTFSSSGNDVVFIGMLHVLSTNLPARILAPTSYSEYWTRHLVDGRIVQCDQSISLAAGYMTEEVTGTSAFVFMHKEDVRWVICVLRQMYDESKEFGESYYRLMSRSGQFLYMRTRGFLEIDKQKNVQSFVCVNSVLDEDYGKRMLEEMKRKYSVIVDVDKQPIDKVTDVDDPPVEDPKRLECIVMHLVTPSYSTNTFDVKLVPPSKENIISAIKSSEKVVQETGVQFDTRKRKKQTQDIDKKQLIRLSELQDS